MASKLNRRVQHRPAKDSQRAHEVADLKREVGRLIIQNASLKRHTELGGTVLTPEVVEDAYKRMIENIVKPQEKFTPPNTCPNCGSVYWRVDLGRVVLDICPSCKTKTKVG